METGGPNSATDSNSMLGCIKKRPAPEYASVPGRRGYYRKRCVTTPQDGPQSAPDKPEESAASLQDSVEPGNTLPTIINTPTTASMVINPEPSAVIESVAQLSTTNLITTASTTPPVILKAIGSIESSTEVVDIVDVDDYEVKPLQKRQPEKPLNLRNNAVAKCLLLKWRSKLVSVMNTVCLTDIIWRGGIYEVSRQDLQNLLLNKETRTDVIDGYALIRREANEHAPNFKSLTLSTYASMFIMKEDPCGIQLHLHDELLKSVAYCRRVLVPIHHFHAYHYTLLYIDFEEKKCYHLNPLKPRRAQSKDECFENAKLVSRELQSYLTNLRDNAKDYILHGTRTRVYKKGGTCNSTIVKQLTDEERQTMEWVQTIQVEMGLEEMPNCPQQMAGTVDCGIAVMYYIKELSAGCGLPQQFAKHTCTKMRAEVITSFLSHAGGIELP